MAKQNNDSKKTIIFLVAGLGAGYMIREVMAAKERKDLIAAAQSGQDPLLSLVGSGIETFGPKLVSGIGDFFSNLFKRDRTVGTESAPSLPNQTTPALPGAPLNGEYPIRY